MSTGQLDLKLLAGSPAAAALPARTSSTGGGDVTKTGEGFEATPSPVDHPSPALIALRDRDGLVVAYAIVDDVNYDELSQWRWSLDYRDYAIRGERFTADGLRRQRTVRMHAAVLGSRPGLDIDHINRNKLDNRRANLRHVTRSENLANRAPSTPTRVTATGVRFDKLQRRWIVVLDGRRSGSYETEQEALAVREALISVRAMP